MNRKYGLAATAWMLGSGLLLDAGLSAEAQVVSTQPANNAKMSSPSAEGNRDNPSPAAPRSRARANHAVYEGLTSTTITRRVQPIGAEEDSSAKNAPRRLKDFLRTTVKPIRHNTQTRASNGPLSAGHKFLDNHAASDRPSASAKSLELRPDSRSDVQPAELEESSPVGQPNSQNGFAPSPIQQQLEELYRRDGRQVPQSNFQQTPINAAPQPPTAQSQFLMPGSRPTVMPRVQIQRPTPRPNIRLPNPSAVPPNNKISRTGGILSRINPFKSRSTPTPLQPPTPSPTPINAVGKPASDPQDMQPQATVAPNGFGHGDSVQPKPMTPQSTAAPIILPQASTATNANVAPRSELSNTLPPVPGDPGFPATTVQAQPASSVDDALDNVFTEMEEDAADDKPVDNRKADDSQKESNPFSGLSLDSQLPTAPEPQAVETTVSGGSATNRDADNDSRANAEKQDDPLPSGPSDERTSKKTTEAKLKLIAERTELKGLKGFCPVALRDDRDLQNALPEHASQFKGRTYHFSSSDAKATFDEQPEQYAPMAGGNDVVLLKTKYSKEGSLDFAVWYKDRLYLFTSQETLEHFIATPSEFVIKD